MKKTSKKTRRYSAEFKLRAILDMRENHLSYRATVRKYWTDITSLEVRNHIGSLRRWERTYLEYGSEGLMEERRGKAKKVTKEKLSKDQEKDLIEENQNLRMEIEYLKKLSALVLADEQTKCKKHK